MNLLALDSKWLVNIGLDSEKGKQVLTRKKWSECYEGILEEEYKALKASSICIKQEFQKTWKY